MTPEETFQLLFYTDLIGWFLLIISYMSAGPWMIAYTKAKLLGKKVAIEYDKTKEYKPYPADIPKNMRGVIKLPGDRGIVGIRRESIGHSNKTQTMLFSTEFEYTISPTEIAGKRYFKIDPKLDITTGFIEEGKFIEAPAYHPKAQSWVKYPGYETVTPEEFVKFQNINADPLLTEHYAQHKEQALRDKINNPAAMFVAQYGWFIIALLVVGGIVYMWISQNNQGAAGVAEAAQCKDLIIDLFNRGVCQSRAGLEFNISSIRSGGAVV
jgi:hypothetical protein